MRDLEDLTRRGTRFRPLMRPGTGIGISPLAVACIAALTLGALTRVAAADDRWSETVTFERADSTAIRISEPEGYQVSVTIAGNISSDTAPAVFRVPNVDGFYPVTFVAPSGTKWTKKLEVRRFQITGVRVKHVAEARPAPPPAGAAAVRSYVGSVFNKVATCGKKLAARVDFIDADGQTGATLQVGVGAMNQATLPGGTYDVRAYVWDAGAKDWTYQVTSRTQIGADNWAATLICGKGPLEVRFGN